MLRFFKIEKYRKWTKGKEYNVGTERRHYTQWTCFTFILISYITFWSLCSFEWLISEKEPICSFVGKEYVCEGLKLLRLGWELKFVSSWRTILSISSRYFNYHIKNEWTPKKYTCVEKALMFLANIYIKNIRNRCEICSKLKIKTPERYFINCDFLKQLFPVFLLLPLNK